MQKWVIFIIAALLSLSQACSESSNNKDQGSDKGQDTIAQQSDNLATAIQPDQYVEVTLNADLDHLSDNQKAVLKKLIKAARQMDEVFWHQAYGPKDSLKQEIDNRKAWRYAKINYGPWDRLADNKPFIEGYGPKPDGANFYPQSMSEKAFKQADLKHKRSLYTLIRKDTAGNLKTQWYHEAFNDQHRKASNLLKEAADITENQSLAKYLRLKSQALMNDQYKASTRAWLDLENNLLDIIIGPIETYEDQLFGYKASHEGMVLIKDKEWSQRLDRYAQYLPKLQSNLPVGEKFKQEEPGRDAQLNAYQIVYYAGSANAGPKTIAKNLPNDEEIQNKKGSRRMQLKNAMRAKFDKILKPISDVLIEKEQQQYLTFKAFFGCTMFHEVAHGLGINNTINDKGPVRKALKEHASAIEEGKADILGIFMIQKLMDWGHLEGNIKDYYTTFMASIFRSIRFGAASAHGKANMIRFNYFKQKGAFERQPDGTYQIDYNAMEKAITDLSNKILQIQGKGDYKGAKRLIQEKGIIQEQLKDDLNRLEEKAIPVDITFKQGMNVLGLANQKAS